MSSLPPPALLLNQLDQLKNPDAAIVLGEYGDAPMLSVRAAAYQGLKTGDDGRSRRFFWEVSGVGTRWLLYQSTVDRTQSWGGCEAAVDWSNAGKDMARLQGLSAWGRSGVTISQMRELPASMYSRTIFDSNVSPIVPSTPDHLPAIWCFCSSPEFNRAVRAIDQKLNVTNATLVKVPFDLDRWRKVAEEQYPNGLPEPYSDDPTQWLFHGHPSGSVVWDEVAKRTAEGPLRTDSTVLQVAAARLLGYRWPAEQDAEMRLADEQRQWVRKAAELHEFEDPDGVVCVPAVLKERSAADRLRDVLAAAFPGKWSLSLEESLLEAAGFRGRGVEAWLRDGFFQQHCQLFGHRPFVWHVWDGRRDGFSALVNYHKLDRAKLDKLTYSYLGDWISRQKQAAEAGTPGAEGRLGAAQDLQAKLKLISDGETPHDIYVRWKGLAEQAIGWEPDLHDGVRLNIRPFMTAGVLRWSPNINWNKDRGKDPSPNCGGTTERLNDLHFSLEQKRKAREGKG